MPTILNKYYPVRKIIFFLGEGLLIFSTFLFVYLAFSGWRIFLLELVEDLIRAGVVTIVFQCSLYFFDLYDLRKPGTTMDTAIRMMQSFGVGCIVLGMLYFVFPSLIISSKIFWCCYVIICVEILSWRVLYYRIIARKLFSREIVIIGAGETAKKIFHEIESHQDCGFTVLAFVSSKEPTFPIGNIPLLPDLDALNSLNLTSRIERIVVALGDRRGKMPIPDLLQYKLQGTPIEEGISFFESLTGKILVEKVNPAWLIFSQGFDKGKVAYICKRFNDLFLSVIGLLLTLPVCAITALLIKLESPGPIFYLQERVCERGKTFKVVKFRSMRNDAEKGGAVWASQNDSRVTKVGGLIRKVRIDEIPQMWNVLKGEMSFVGPRPERPVFVEQLTACIPYYSLRHSVKPGITGWAQVCYPYGASEEDALRKLEYDLYYIKNQSIFLDLLIVFRTIKTVLFQRGSR